MRLDTEQWAEDTEAGRGLVHYIELVAAAVGAGRGGTLVSLELPATAYLALDERLPGYPDHDVALIWHERTGWSIGIESGREIVTLGQLGGDVVPPPQLVARFVLEMSADPAAAGRPDVLAPDPVADPADLGERLATYAVVAERPVSFV